jgi:hypothetical protein
MPRCIEWGEERTRECTETRDRGTNQCNSWADRGSRRCCTWWPCSMFCRVFYWVANVVCVGYHWVANVVCVAWTWVSTAVCLAWEVVTAFVGAIITTLETIFNWVLGIVAFVFNLILSIPYVGRWIAWVPNIIWTAVYSILSLPDLVLGAIGIRPEKKLRVKVVILRNERGQAIETVDNVVRSLQSAIDAYASQANVRVMLSGPAEYSSGFSGNEVATRDWVTTHPDKGGAPAENLDVRCGGGAAVDDLGTTGAWFEAVMAIRDFYGNVRRLIGYGAPVVVFVVRSYPSSAGCSLGPLTNYVTVLTTSTVGAPPPPVPPTTLLSIDHELGHACNLTHTEDLNNMMTPGAPGQQLATGQILLLRASRHVTYF